MHHIHQAVDKGETMPNVEVRDADGKLLHTYEIIVGEYGTLITDDDVFAMARQNAIEDELVNQDRVDELTFSVAGRGV